MKIIFVGDKPSSKNIDPNIPFWGTGSYKRLMEWVGRLQIYVTDIRLVNKANAGNIGNALFRNLKLNIVNEAAVIIALGEEAAKRLKANKIEFYKLDHPSGLNRKLNDKRYEEEMLNGCRKWLRQQGYYPERRNHSKHFRRSCRETN